MIILQKIQLNNFLSHAKTSISFESEQKLLIDGVSGSGKSSIVEGLIWALYGKGRSDNRSLIKSGAESAEVDVTLFDTETETNFYISRKITAKGKHEISVDVLETGEMEPSPLKVEGLKQLQEYIERDILRSSYTLFINSIACLQENSDTFVKQKASDRKNLILEIVNAAAYDEYYVKAREKISEFESQSSSITGNISALDDRLMEEALLLNSYDSFEKINERLSQEKMALETTSQHRIEIEAIESVISEIQRNIGIISATVSMKSQTVVNIKSSIVTAEQEIEKAKHALSMASHLIEDKRTIEEASKELDKMNEDAQAIREWQRRHIELLNTKPSLTDYSNLKNRYQADIKLWSDRVIEPCHVKCPSCGYDMHEPCPKLAIEKTNSIERLQQEIKVIDEKQKTEQATMDLFVSRVAELGAAPAFDEKKYNEYTAIVNQLQQRISQTEFALSDKQAIIKQKEEFILEARLQLEAAIESESISKKELEALNISLADVRNKLNGESVGLLVRKEMDIREKISKCEYEIKEVARIGTSINNVKENISKLRIEEASLKEKIDQLKVLKEAFGNNGIKSIIIDHVIPRLEDKINSILSKLSDFTVRLDTQKSSVSSESILEGLFITICNDQGETFDFQSYSGGEKVKVSMAINEALADISKVSFRVLDEAIVSLDKDSTEKFTETMEELRKHVNQVICISHISEIKDLFQERITVKKINGTSSVTYT